MIKILFICHGSTAKNRCKVRYIGIGQKKFKDHHILAIYDL
mgnify:CR=1 FL=1